MKGDPNHDCSPTLRNSSTGSKKKSEVCVLLPSTLGNEHSLDGEAEEGQNNMLPRYVDYRSTIREKRKKYSFECSTQIRLIICPLGFLLFDHRLKEISEKSLPFYLSNTGRNLKKS
jgi:hypothetical protein